MSPEAADGPARSGQAAEALEDLEDRGEDAVDFGRDVVRVASRADGGVVGLDCGLTQSLDPLLLGLEPVGEGRNTFRKPRMA